MTQEKVIKIQADYRDSGLVERIAASFRRFWVDIKWMNMECDSGVCTIYMSINDAHNLGNLDLSIVTLSKMVDIDFVEELEGYEYKKFEMNYKKSKKFEWGVISE
ncbi:ACT domain-containing protein [Ferroplasma acidarmanus]|uniref:Uncharacterized protein n=1 Tax=Ferroplasma acidarmanus Fer1 TaxID=333146 RepID=S0ANJ5_FERAC|nr:hypothetical protein [Ferroplasma acidarmanus]AGO60312.1 hypothetical protein FACI_IFERC00001G0332 [Ferroplasma acidarmanus Fer1]